MPREYIPVELKRRVIERAEETCEYCLSQAKFALDSLVFEHIVPFSRGGETIAENLALACQGCNNYKYIKIEGLDPISAQFAPLYHPREMLWSEHFAWSEDTTLIVGLTPIGRATIVALRMNREGVVNLRRVLRITGQHPPR